MKRLLLSMIMVSAVATLSAQEVLLGVKAGTTIGTSTFDTGVLTPKIKLGSSAGFYVGAAGTMMFSEKTGLQVEIIYNGAGKTTIGTTSDVDGALSKIAEREIGGFDENVYDDLMEILDGSMDHVGIESKSSSIYIPVLARYQATPALSLMAGPYFNIGFGGSFELTDEAATLCAAIDTNPMFENMPVIVEAAGDMLKSFDLGLSLGLEYAFDCGFFVEGRYNFGLLNKVGTSFKFPEELEAGIDTYEIDELFGLSPKLKNQFLQIGIGYRF